MTDKISQSQLWSVLDTVRGELSIYDTSVTLAALLYLRWTDFYETEQAAIAVSDKTDYKSILPVSLHWRSWYNFPAHDLTELFTKQIPAALKHLKNFTHSTLAAQLYLITPYVEKLGRLSSGALEELIRWVEEQPFETPSERRTLLDVFDWALGRMYEKSPEYHRTPNPIAEFLVKLADPKPGESIYDPCFGMAELLTASWNHISNNATATAGQDSKNRLKIAGVESNPGRYIIGFTRLALAGVKDPQLELKDSLKDIPSVSPKRGGFDIVLANPPWGINVRDDAGRNHFPLQSKYETGLYIQHALMKLRPEGRAVLVVPEGFLFRVVEQNIRKLLVEQHSVEAIISFPEGAFPPYTGSKTSAILLRSGGPTKKIRMVDLEKYIKSRTGKTGANGWPQLGATFGVVASFLAGGLLGGGLLYSIGKSLLGNPSPNKENSLEKIGDEILLRDEKSDCVWDIGADSLPEIKWDLTVKRRDLNVLSATLGLIPPDVAERSIIDCCEVISGRSIPKDELLDGPPLQSKPRNQTDLTAGDTFQKGQQLLENQSVPYVRIQDIQHDQISKASSWVSCNVVNSLDPKFRLKTGDVLLSKAGVIGKAGVVLSRGVGAIASGGLYVLRPYKDQIDPDFLLAYLNSNECQAWMNDWSRGSTIRYLTKGILEKIPVPVPSLQIQREVVAQCKEHGVDALEYLVQALTHVKANPIMQWIDDSLAILPSASAEIEEPLNFALLEKWSENTERVRQQIVENGIKDSSLSKWFLPFSEAISQIRWVQNLPKGPGMLSVLQAALRSIDFSLSTIREHTPMEVKASRLVEVVSTWLDLACAELLSDVKLVISTDKSSLPFTGSAEITLIIHNEGSLPLRDVNIQTDPNWGVHSIAYLEEDKTVTANLFGNVDRNDEQTFTISVNWSGSRLDRYPVHGSCELAFKLVDAVPDSDGKEMDIGGSPYVTGDPVRPERNDVFFGREDLLEQIRRQIESANVVLLEGNRRSGKSSVLWHLEGRQAVPGWLGVYCSLQAAEGSKRGVGVPTVEVFRVMAISIAKSLNKLGEDTPLPDGSILPKGTKLGIAKSCRNGIGETSSFSDFRNYVEVALETLSKHDLGLFLMLDEFDKLQEGIDNQVTSPQVPENIRFIIQNYPKFCAILTGSRRMKRLREEYWSALFGLGTRFGVTSLSDAHARRLVTEPVKGRLTYSPEAIKRAVFLTSGQPYLLQCLCNRVFDMSAQSKTWSVTLDLVNQAAEVLVEDNEHFASLWSYTQSDQRRFILALCNQETDGPVPLSLSEIQGKLGAYGIEVREEMLIEDLDFLRELELIKFVADPGGHYVPTIPLMGTWIERQQDFMALKRKAILETEDQYE